MNYQNIACWGDSLTYGARTYGCYPLHLVEQLNTRTRYVWRAHNYSSNGHRARDLWFRLAHELPAIRDTYQACLLIGTNDVGTGSELTLFEQYYRQSIDALLVQGFKVVYCGEIPPIFPDGHSFFGRQSADERDKYNDVVRGIVNAVDACRLVPLADLDETCFCDPVHFNEQGNRRVAERFADAIVSY